jgi:hypothetical protein
LWLVNNFANKKNNFVLLQIASNHKKVAARLSERPVKTAIEGTAGTSLQANLIVPQFFLPKKNLITTVSYPHFSPR